MHNLKKISSRAIAYIILKVSGTLGGGFVMGIEVRLYAGVAPLDAFGLRHKEHDFETGRFGHRLTADVCSLELLCYKFAPGR